MAAALVLNNRDEALQEALQYVPNMFGQEDYSIDQVRHGDIYMVSAGKTLPIHPEPNADHKVSMWLSEFHCVVADASDVNPDNGRYVKTILPPGWMHKSCLDDGAEQVITKVTPKTFDQFHKPPPVDPDAANGTCADTCSCIRNISLKIRKQPVYLIAVFLFLHFLSECVIFADLITDIAVAFTLAQAHESWLFMLTMVFVFAPYYIAWAAAFGYLQKKAMDSTAQAALSAQNAKGDSEDETGGRTGDAVTTDKMDIQQASEDNGSDNEKDGKGDGADGDEKDKKDAAQVVSTSPDRKIQLLILLFSIAPIGVLLLMLLDVYLLVEDLIIKPILLCLNRNNALREESLAEQGYKKLRRVSEVVAETLCQTVLQFYIYVRFSQESTQVDVGVVLLSLITSILVLISWGIVLKIESQSFGLHFYEYVTVVLQGSFNFVPYLPAIERGKRDKVNWTNFKFDSHSVGLVSKALISPDCELTTIKLSGYSLSKLTRHECRFLGQMLADSPKNRVDVIFSRSRLEVQRLFERFDIDKSRTFDFREFLQLCCALRQSDDGLVSAEDVASIFKDIADTETREVYLTDLLLTINRSTEKILVIDYDSPVMFALKESHAVEEAKSPEAQADADEEDEDQIKPNLLTFMIAAKVIDEDAFDIVTTDLVVSGKYGPAIMMCEDRGLPLVVEVLSASGLDAHDQNGLSDPYVNVSIAGQVKRTLTVPKNLNPFWGEALLFLIPPEDIPAMLSEHDFVVGTGQTVYHQGAKGGGGHHSVRRNSQGFHDSAPQIIAAANANSSAPVDGGSSVGVSDASGAKSSPMLVKHLAGQPGRLEVNIKVYDYDDDEDDDFMGSYKHFLKYSVADFKEHHDWTQKDETTKKPILPKVYEHVLKNRNDAAGTIRFRVYCGAIGWYLNSHKNVDGAYSKEAAQQPLTVKTT